MLFKFWKFLTFPFIYLFTIFVIKGLKENFFEKTSIYFRKWLKETNIWNELGIIIFSCFSGLYEIKKHSCYFQDKNFN